MTVRIPRQLCSDTAELLERAAVHIRENNPLRQALLLRAMTLQAIATAPGRQEKEQPAPAADEKLGRTLKKYINRLRYDLYDPTSIGITKRLEEICLNFWPRDVWDGFGDDKEKE